MKSKYSMGHVLVLQYLITFPVAREQTLQNLLFLATAAAGEGQYHEGGFYDFIRTGSGAYSAMVSKIVAELRDWGMVEGGSFSLTPQGREAYYALASLLAYHPQARQGLERVLPLGDDGEKVNQGVFNHLTWRRARFGDPLFPAKEMETRGPGH